MLDADRETFMTARYALYYAPGPRQRLVALRLGLAGPLRGDRDTRLRSRTSTASIRRCCTPLTAAPRRYGFHATLKPPFALARGASLAALAQALDRFCARQTALRLPPLEVAELDGFLALVPRPGTRASMRSPPPACAAWTAFARRRLPRNSQRRRAAGLSPREDSLLQRWGYPYVMDRFRFHFSLTGSLRDAPPHVVAALRDAAAAAVAALADEPLVLDSICIFEEPAAGADLRIVHRARFGHRGRLIYVVGPSGAGKDSLLEWMRARLPADSGVRLARRTITRPAGAGGEDHIAATDAQFDEALARGEFALHWRANGHRYGIGREIEQWLAAGQYGGRERLARVPYGGQGEVSATGGRACRRADRSAASAPRAARPRATGRGRAPAGAQRAIVRRDA